ncbi:hypothetical protein [Pseudomonas sp. LP_7_YM]|uniref:hypothetical protein n=1 Tax=Pseudomonas sp. LP_7_YM TaxID=2485137 RepID=UPI0010ED824F|nr:hypothetical protein [Pseudomonas sp. LP_7_YM]TDV67656.1 hypothetical protein EC915_103191 [Pseudomonas sp. LP_7_YM]
MQLEWLADFVELARLEVIEKAGTVIAHDRGTPIITPHDNCVLVQPFPDEEGQDRKQL